MFGLTVFGDVLVGIASYALSIYTWPYLRTFFVTVESEIASLEARLSALKAVVSPTVAAAATAAPVVKPPGT